MNDNHNNKIIVTLMMINNSRQINHICIIGIANKKEYLTYNLWQMHFCEPIIFG